MKKPCKADHDYRDLLKRYINWVSLCEGVTFLDSDYFGHRKEYFSDAEWEELQKIEKEPYIILK